MQQVQQSCKSCGRILDMYGRKFPPKSVFKNYYLSQVDT